ncbi:MAG: transposase [Syntrophomonadaceae bacterium]|jgi:IS5 family transposase
MELELKKRLPLFFSALDLRPIVKKLRSDSPQGAKGFPKDAILRALLAAPLVSISTFTGLVKRLELDIKFRYQCGFRVGKVPSVATFSRTFQKVTETKALNESFTVLVNECREREKINGEVIAIDSTAINAYEQKPRNRKCGLRFEKRFLWQYADLVRLQASFSCRYSQ